MPYLEGLKIDAISDTHGRHKKLALPGGDILIHSGDVSGRGHSGEILPFLDWYAEQDYSTIILIPGNHDFGFEEEPERYVKECADRKIILLNDSGCTVEGIKVWGSPVQPWFHNWAFNRARTQGEVTRLHGWIKTHWDLIPEDTEILVTHGPPYGILDDANARGYENHVGCQELEKRIRETKVKLHVFGHIHEGAGYKYLDGRTYVNASSLDEMYMFEAPGYRRIVKQGDDYFVEDLATTE
jgi:Icc-related predicted phosphoesterase